MTGLQVLVTGATGNLGSSVVAALCADDRVERVVGLARRKAPGTGVKSEFRAVDLTMDELDRHVHGMDVVIHLAWMFQPARQPETTWQLNVLGSIRLFAAVARCGVPSLVYSSSVGAYSPGPKDRAVTEDWPTHGWPGAAYTREKPYLERFLDGFEPAQPNVRVVRIRPGFLFKREAASEQRRIFGGRFAPNAAGRPGLVPIVPDIPGLVFQACHTDDAADAFRLAAVGAARGAFNIAADPVVDASLLAELLGARPVRMPGWPVRAGVSAAWWLHAIPASPGLLDAVLRLPVMDTGRARHELGWTPRFDSTTALREFLRGLRTHAGGETVPLAPDPPGIAARVKNAFGGTSRSAGD